MTFQVYDFDQAAHNPQYKVPGPELVLADGWVIPYPTAFADIMHFYQEQTAADPQHKLLLILDDIDQAFYTCGHRCDMDDLNGTEGFEDLPGLTPYAFEDGERCYDAGTVAEFPIRYHHVMRQVEESFPVISHEALTESENAESLSWEEEDWAAFIKLMADPDASLSWSSPETFLCRVPVQKSWELVAALPNGYFGGDLDPYENLVLAQLIEQDFSYQLFGIGAELLGFVRQNDITPEEAQAFADFLMRFFSTEGASSDDQPIGWKAYFGPQIVDHLLKQPYVFISYSENGFENWR